MIGFDLFIQTDRYNNLSSLSSSFLYFFITLSILYNSYARAYELYKITTNTIPNHSPILPPGIFAVHRITRMIYSKKSQHTHATT